jgi:protein tyrosine phosphatase (PTP) superfamily phosphohydrolase (DUF442 family)
VTSVDEIRNFRQVTPALATSGQPSESQLAAIAQSGYDVIVNLALHDDPRYSLPDEAASVASLGIEYVHIPVKFDAPTESDLDQFIAVMKRVEHRRVWIHCASNLRVPTFLGLYWNLQLGWPVDRAFALMESLWQPNQIWSQFISAQLAKPRAA